ncbi:MAG: ACT domain-containing protein [Chloroflexi bacterium]|nr:ACT domain-containing protein [Chloroflexota bacterium]
MAKTPQQALADCQLYTDEIAYIFIKLPPSAIWAGAGVLAEIGEAFCALIADKDELTLVMPEDAWEEFQPRLPGAERSATYHLITFDIELEHEMVGFLAAIAQHLAASKIPVMALSAFSRDHLLVPEQHFDQAWESLVSLRQQT